MGALRAFNANMNIDTMRAFSNSLLHCRRLRLILIRIGGTYYTDGSRMIASSIYLKIEEFQSWKNLANLVTGLKIRANRDLRVAIDIQSNDFSTSLRLPPRHIAHILGHLGPIGECSLSLAVLTFPLHGTEELLIAINKGAPEQMRISMLFRRKEVEMQYLPSIARYLAELRFDDPEYVEAFCTLAHIKNVNFPHLRKVHLSVFDGDLPGDGNLLALADLKGKLLSRKGPRDNSQRICHHSCGLSRPDRRPNHDTQLQLRSQKYCSEERQSSRIPGRLRVCLGSPRSLASQPGWSIENPSSHYG